MNKTLSFVRLDFYSVKPYLTLKNFFIFLVLALIIGSSSGAMSISMLMMYAAIYVSYPFVVAEKSKMDILYATLSIKRKSVVLGRYVFALVMQVGGGIFAYAAVFIASSFLRRGFNYVENLGVLVGVFAVFSLIQAIQLPIFFKLGYTKSKYLVYIPYMLIPITVTLFNSVLKDVLPPVDEIMRRLEWFASNPGITAAICAGIWFLIMLASYRISLSFYKKREF